VAFAAALQLAVKPEQVMLLAADGTGDAGARTELIVTAKDAALLVPQLLVAVTETVPLLDPIVMFIELVPDPEVIVHPEGKVQL